MEERKGQETKTARPPGETAELRRDLTVWGSYMWGFADVGASMFVGLGLVLAYTQGWGGLAFGLAGIVYIMVGLAYTELAAAYPVAGGGQYFTLRGLGDFWGFIAGSALVLDYTIDIALFSMFSAGYANFFLPYFFGPGIDESHFVIDLGPFHNIRWLLLLETVVIIVILCWLNVRGIRESSLVNEIIGALVIVLELCLVVFGFVVAWHPEIFAFQWHHQKPDAHRFVYGASLAIISFVGLESISQAAQETRRPATIVPRTSIALIFTVFLSANAFTCLGLGLQVSPETLPANHPMVVEGAIPDRIADQPWEILGVHHDNPVAVVCKALPLIGIIAGPLAAGLGAFMLFISANSGVMSASRVAYSMSRFQCISPWFEKVHSRFRTPTRTIIIFSLIGIVQTVLAGLTGPKAMDTLANMYAFGASLGYTLVFLSLIRLRFVDPYSPRPYKMPFNLRLRYRQRKVGLPVLGLLGTAAILTVLFGVVWTHAIGRIAGPGWVVLWFAYYAWYRRKRGMPVFRSLSRDWESQQKEVLASAEEFDLLEQYKVALAERDERQERAP